MIAASGRPASRRPCTRQSWIARQERKLSEPPRRITALPDFRHSTPASAATFGRLSKITAITPSGTRTRSMVMPFGRCQLSVTAPTGSAMLAHGRDAVGHRLDARRCQRQAVDEGRGRAAGANLRDILGIGREDRRAWAADGALDGVERAVLLLRRGKRQHPRGGARAAAEFGHQGGRSALPSIAFSGAVIWVQLSVKAMS